MSNSMPDDFARSVDDLFGDELIDQESLTRVRASDQPPAGTYVTDPQEHPVSVTSRILTPKDGRPMRQLVGFRGRAEARVGDKTYTHLVAFDLSPDERFALEYVNGEATGEQLDGEDGRIVKYDLSTRLWKDACVAYRDTYREAPKTKGQVIEYLSEKSIRIRMYINPKGELAVGSLKAGGR